MSDFIIPVPISQFANRQLMSEETHKMVGVKIIWSFSIIHNGLTALKYTAQDDYISKGKSSKDA
jgi:hypothetical protein